MQSPPLINAANKDFYSPGRDNAAEIYAFRKQANYEKNYADLSPFEIQCEKPPVFL